jgi:hypothetical protein
LKAEVFGIEIDPSGIQNPDTFFEIKGKALSQAIRADLQVFTQQAPGDLKDFTQ